MQDQEREIMLDLVRVTEAAALRAARLMGKGDPDAVFQAASDGMRGMLELVDISGHVVLGAAERDREPGLLTGLFSGDRVGRGRKGEVDVAVYPVEGTRLVARGLPNAMSIFTAAQKGSLATPSLQYLDKIAVGPKAVGRIDITRPVAENLRAVAAALRRKVRDLTVVILDRPRHAELIERVRETGARIKLISDGDVSAGVATALEDSGVDMLLGMGGAREGVLTAAALCCLGGEIQARPWFPDDGARMAAMTRGVEVERVYRAEDLAHGDSIIFSATGVTDGDLLRGVRYRGEKALTHSVVMRARTRTVRFIEAQHDLRVKTIRSQSKRREEMV